MNVSNFGLQGDISNLCIFGLYEWLYYHDGGSLPKNKLKIGRVLGPIKNEGNEMAQAVMNAKARVVPLSNICKPRKDEIFSETDKVTTWWRKESKIYFLSLTIC